MKKLTFILASALLMTACATNQTKNDETENNQQFEGVDKTNFDESIVRNDDFYQWATGGWQQKNPLKPEYSRYGSFDVLRESNEIRINELFGSYEQDDNPENGKEDILWRVIDMAGNKALVVSEYCLDAQPYHDATADTAVMWDYASIRTWLNGDFMDEAFTSQEDNIIRNQLISADSNPAYSTIVGTGTRDRVFLLSALEVQRYFASDEDRVTVATAYAKGLGLSYLKKNDRCGWWLRTPGAEQHMAVYVSNTGEVVFAGDGATYMYGVRPAMWISVG